MLDDRPYMRQPSYSPRLSMTSILVAVNVVCFILQSIVGFYTHFDVIHHLGLSVGGITSGAIYQLLTYQLLHADFLHLLFNCLVIFIFGRTIEDTLGIRGLLQLYVLSGVAGGLLQLAFGFAFPPYFGGSVVGASAGASGLIAAFAIRSPNAPIGILFLPITMPAKVLLYIEFAFAIFGILVPVGHVAHAAHLGGMLLGIGYMRYCLRENTGKALIVWRPWRNKRRGLEPRELATTAPKKKPAWRRPVSQVTEELPPGEFISKEVDPILDKISAHGIHSLTDRERQILEAARKRMAKR
jgi:membrane associated rhomboid family serine protease